MDVLVPGEGAGMDGGRLSRSRSPRAVTYAGRWVAVALLAAAAIPLFTVASSCGPNAAPAGGRTPSPPAATPRSGGTYVVPIESDPASLAPFSTGDLTHLEIAHQIFEGLVAYEPLANGTIATVPCLAESWTANADATVWTFRLRRGVRFQEPVGREVTSRDVVACFRYGADPASESFWAYTYAILRGTDGKGLVTAGPFGVEALGRYRIRFTLKRPFASFPDTLGMPGAWVWPVGRLREVGRRGFERRPVGTGPFLFVRHTPGESLELVRNPEWWDAASDRPYLDGVRFRVFSSVTEQQLAFERGAIDYTWVQEGQADVARSLPQVANGEWSAVSLPLLILWYLNFDMHDPVVGGARGLPLRQAVDCAVDREKLAAAEKDGVYLPQAGLVPPVLAGWDEAAPAPAYDPARARALYEAAGRPLLTVTYPDDRGTRASAERFRDMLAASGIRVRLHPEPGEKIIGSIERGRPPAMFLMGWQADYPGADNFLYDLFHSSMSQYTSGGSYDDPDVDRLLTSARAESDPARHLQLNLRAAQEIQEDVPVIPLFEFAQFRLVDGRIGGFNRSPLGWTDMWRLWVR